MRTNRTFALVLIVSVLFSHVAEVDAGGRNRVGGSGASQLLIPVGARDMALGGASIATTSGIEALHWNPAGLASTQPAASIMITTMDYIADMQLNYAALGADFGTLGHLAFNIKALSVGDIAITTATAPDGTGGNFSVNFFTLGVTYANNLTDRIRMGSTIHYISEALGRASANGVSFSAGVQYDNLGGMQDLDLGVAIKHIGTRMAYGGSGLIYQGQVNNLRRPGSFYQVETSSADLPSLFEIGLSYNREISDSQSLSVNSVFQHQNYDYDESKIGLEYNLNQLLFLRAGFSAPMDAEDETFIYGTSFGVGLHPKIGGLSNIEFDYAYTQADYFDALNTFSIKIGF